MAFYLKYRPQSLDELVGQESVKRILSSSFLNNKLSHAYLFVGPRGSGKTSTARILAKMVNCELVRSSELVIGSGLPCNKCSTCLSITDGSNLDLIEVDAASNRGIDDIRALREKIKLSPTSSKKKIYIIDEVHMLTTEAFNALLKTLEEPPSHALFILATTDVQKIPQTILSRVQRLDFKLATTQELIESFAKIIKEEKIDIEIDALKVLAKRAEGSFRDGIKLLEQISSVGGKITVKQLEDILKSGQLDDSLEFLENLSKKDSRAGLIMLHKVVEGGVDIKIFTLNLMDCLRNIIFIKKDLGGSLVEGQYSEENFVKLKELSSSFVDSDLMKILNLLQESLEKLKFASIPSLPLELVVVELCNTESIMLEGAKRPIASNEKDSTFAQQREASLIKPIKSALQNDDQEEPEIINVQPVTGIQTQQPTDTPSSDILKLKEKWTFVLETIRPYNFSLEALLRSVNITECSDATLIIEVPYSFHQRILEAPKNREILESILSDILGRSIRITTVLGNRTQRREDIANVEVAQDDEIIRAAAEIFSSDTIN